MKNVAYRLSRDGLDLLAREMSAPDATVEIDRSINPNHQIMRVRVTRPAMHVQPTLLRSNIYLRSRDVPRDDGTWQSLKTPDHGILNDLPRELVHEVRFAVPAWNNFLSMACAEGMLSQEWLGRCVWASERASAAIREQIRSGHQPTAAEIRVSNATLSIAALIAVGVREQARAEWVGEQAASQAGESGSAMERIRFSVDLIRAALQIRASRLIAPGIDLLDCVVRSEARTYRAVGLIVFITAAYVLHTEGLTGVIADGESLFVEGSALYGAARWRRKALKRRNEISGENTDQGMPPDPNQ